MLSTTKWEWIFPIRWRQPMDPCIHKRFYTSTTGLWFTVATLLSSSLTTPTHAWEVQSRMMIVCRCQCWFGRQTLLNNSNRADFMAVLMEPSPAVERLHRRPNQIFAAKWDRIMMYYDEGTSLGMWIHLNCVCEFIWCVDDIGMDNKLVFTVQHVG